MIETFSGSGIYRRDIHKYNLDANVIRYRNGQMAMKEVAEYYSCRFIDVDKECGINLFNMFDGYFGANNVHPLTKGYEKWGETLANLY